MGIMQCIGDNMKERGKEEGWEREREEKYSD